MKRYLIIMVSIIVVLIALFYLYYVKGVYLPFKQEATISTPFYVSNKGIFNKDDNEEMIIRGVELDSSYGPKRSTEFAIEEDTYFKWFKQIQDMGANTIRISNIYNDGFYKAFYKYNKNRKDPLYLIQGISVDVVEFESKKKIDRLEFYDNLLKDGKKIVDIVHGRKILLTNSKKGNGFFLYDISPWVIGYLIGDEWNQETITYIDKTLDSKPSYKGDYVSTSVESTNFEKMMAEIVETIIGYETRKYHEQRPISVNSTFLMDPFKYPEHNAVQLEKFNTFSIEHIKPTQKLKSGLFASYAFEHFNFSLLPLIEPSEVEKFPNVKNYFDLLQQYHSSPVVISSIGYPSDEYLNVEAPQESILVEQIKMFEAIGYKGNIIRSWQDVWDRRNLANSYAVDLQQINNWHDPLTSTQHFGLIGFKPFRDDVLMKIDGKNGDWQDVDFSYKDNQRKIKMTRDHAYLYFLIEDKAISTENPFYLALDTHPHLGSTNPLITNGKFDKKMDFIVHVDPTKGAKIFVHERYQGVRQNFLELTSGRNPYFYYPDKQSSTFDPVQYLYKDKKILSEKELFDVTKTNYQYSFKEVAPLKVLSPEQDHADVAIKDGHLEIRIPYQLLNIYDPLKFTIHDDYYKHFGVEPLRINKLYLNIGNNSSSPSKSIEIKVKELKALKRVEEFVKPSYYTMKILWKGED